MTVVLIHGMPQTYRLWNGVISHLEREDAVVALDLPGFASPAPSGWRATKEAYVEWIIEQIEPLAERDGPVHLVGHDWGCLLALRVASIRPELLRSVAAGNGPIDEDWPLHAFWDRWNVPGEGERFMEEVLTPERCVAMMKAAGLPDELAEHNTWLVPGGKDVTLALYRSATDVGREWGPDLRKIVVPSVLVWGVRDLIVSVEFGRRMATRMGAKVVELDAGHFWPAEVPAEAAEVLQRHWERAESSPQTILTQYDFVVPA
jgi:pimeloyl-ACP methyl ester carboxylesterase